MLHLLAYHSLKPGDQIRIWMWSDNRTNYIISICRVTDPIAYGLICCILKCLITTCNSDYFSTQHFHPQDIRQLPFNVCLSHKNNAFHSHEGTYCCSRNTMLTSASFGNDPRFAKSLCN